MARMTSENVPNCSDVQPGSVSNHKSATPNQWRLVLRDVSWFFSRPCGIDICTCLALSRVIESAVATQADNRSLRGAVECRITLR
jgi:hypothetical protein